MRKEGNLIDKLTNKLSFLQKFILLFICGVVIPMVVQNLVYYWQTEKNVQEEMLGKLNEAMDDKAEKLSGILEGALTLVRSYYGNEMLYRYLDEEYDSDLDFLVRYQDELKEFFLGSNVYNYQIKNIIVYTDNPTLLNGSAIRRLETVDEEGLGEVLDYLNVQPVDTENGVYLRVAHEKAKLQSVNDSRSISFVCGLDHYRQHDHFDKMLRMDLDPASMVNVLQESNLFANMLLCDTEEKVITAAKGYNSTAKIDVFSAGEQEDGMVVLSREIRGFPLTMYGIYDTGMISEEFRSSRRLSVGISVLCLLFALFCVFAVVGSINRRLHRLVAQSEEIAQGNFVQTKLEENGADEFAILEKSLNHMSFRLQELIDKEYKAQVFQAELEKETNQAKLLALQEQVNPHFMFNALESIRLKAMAKGERETAGVIKYMAKMFRNLLNWNDNIISLREEIGFLDEFLHIQNYRFEDEFSYEIKVSDAACECLLPKMMLQPLVENACVHGVEALSNERWVKVEAQVEGDMLRLSVEDNGGGMSPDKLKELQEMLRGGMGAGKSVGLWNVYRRLVLYYGDKFEFEIDSVPGKGTVCKISIPVQVREAQEGEDLCFRS